MALTLTSLPLTFIPLFPDVVVVSDLRNYIGGSTDLVKEARGSEDLHTPIHPPP